MKQLVEDIKRSNFVYICGNGGSASTADHFAQDLVKSAGIKAISLCANGAVVTALANDKGYDNVFAIQLAVFLKPEDMLVTISGSGSSPNILKAQQFALDIGALVYTFPTMDELNCDMQEAENHHLTLSHKVTKELTKWLM